MAGEDSVANRILAYVGSAFLILLSVLLWMEPSGSSSRDTAAQVGFALGWFWGHFGFAMSGLTVIIILSRRACGFHARLFASVTNALTILFGICLFSAPVWMPEIRISELAWFYTILGCLLVLAGMLNIAAIWQRRTSAAPMPVGEPNGTPNPEGGLQTPHDQAVKPKTEYENVRALGRKPVLRAVSISLCICAVPAAIAAFLWLDGGPRAASASSGQYAADNQADATSHLRADQVFASASPAVVEVVVRDRFFKPLGQGSGFYLTNDGQIVTNFHVIHDASFASVIETNGTVRGVERVVATNSGADLAILKVSRSDGPTLRLSQALPRIGTKVYAIGNPQGFTNTLSEGIISGLRQDTSIPEIQTTAAISPGSSGGPLIGEDGAVVGVTAATWTNGQALNFAVSAAQVAALRSTPAGNTCEVLLIPTNALSETAARTLADVWNQLGKGNGRDALAELEQLHDSPGNDPMYLFTLGVAHNSVGEYQQSLDIMENAIHLMPDRPGFYIVRGAAYEGLTRWQDAIASFQCASRLGDKTAWLYHQGGICHYRLGQEGEAEKWFRYALKLDDTYMPAYESLVRLYERLGKGDECVKLCIQGIARNPSGSFLYLHLSGLYKEEQAFDAAINVLNSGIAANPGNPSLYLMNGHAYMLRFVANGQTSADDYDRAIEMWGKAIELDPSGEIGKRARKQIESAERIRSNGTGYDHNN